MTPEDVTRHFTRADGQFLFARWGRPIAPVVFGVQDATLQTVKGALEAVAALSGQQLAETDPELGANLMVFFFRDWDELPQVPNLDRLVPDLVPLVARLKSVDANQYRVFRFDQAGGIKAAFVFVRVDDDLAAMPADVLALGQVVQTVLLWSDTAFTDRSALAVAGDRTILRPDIAALIRAAYDPVLPVASDDPAMALRLHARMQAAPLT
ncbi:hypothetical protein [Lacimonas salitolerans]|uniref:Uncharacterized protein n=1 Tax=Lacimonas salitolerans TaxID=1323750 RepID=A0ABW4EBN6_9RHOB